MSPEEFWRIHPRPTLQERIDYLENCDDIDARDVRMTNELKALLREREAKQGKC